MKSVLVALMLSLLIPASPVQANELDREDQIKNAERHAADLPQTLIVRKNKLDGSVAVHHSLRKLAPETSSAPKHLKYVPMKATDRVRNELGGDSSKSGWFFYWYAYSYYQPAYYYFGYNYYYQPYYTFHYQKYVYTYYWWR
jgi:hypothetical protein